jgi:acetyl-CoA carboxylase carboxyl transferase subunit alpha
MTSFKLVDGIVDEPLGGAHNDHQAMAQQLKETILNLLAELNALDPQERINQRIDKFCSMGVVIE